MPTNGNHPQPNWEEAFTAFSLAYGFLSKAFYEPPTTELLHALVDDDLFADWPLPPSDEDTRHGLQLLQDYSHAWSELTEPDLEWDYTRLFIGPGHVLAPPWESVYLSREHLLFDQPTLEVRRLYAEYGLQAPRLNAEPDDHLGLELAFLVHLCSLGLAALHQGENPAALIEAQHRFLGEHLLRWAPQCLELVIDNANTDYYRGIAYLTRGCLAQAAVTFSVRLSPAAPL